MRTAIYIEDGVIQLVLTPENEWEKHAIRSFEDKAFKAQIISGSFYDCRGGWIRQSGWYGRDEERSLILRVDKAEPQDDPAVDVQSSVGE